MNLDDIKIDAEFEALLPALANEKREGLRKSIIEEGKVRDPIVVWAETQTLLDGHNRLSLYREESERHMIDPPRVIEKSFASRLDAMRWMIGNQDDKRNWTDAEKRYALGKLYNEERKTPTVAASEKPRESGEFTSSDHNGQNVRSGEEPNTAERIAAEHGVNEKTVRRAGKYAESLDAIRTVNSKAADDIKSGKLKMDGKKLTSKDVEAIAHSGDIATAIRNLRQHGHWKGPQEAPPEPEKPAEPAAKPGVDPQVFKRVMLLEKSYNVLGGHVSWLAANAKNANAKSTLQEMDASLTTVFNGIKKLQKQVKA